MSNENILFAFQTWSEKHEWWIPNSISLNSYYDKQILPPTHENQWFSFPEGIDHSSKSVEQIWEFKANKDEFLLHNKNVKFTLLDDIEADVPYIFPIFIKSSNYFKRHKNIGFSEISKRVLLDTKRGIAKIVLIFPWEGTSGEIRCKDDFKILNQWCIEEGLTLNEVYYIHANLKMPTGDFNFTMIPVNSFITWTRPHDEIVPYNTGSNLFLNYNRNPHYHRCLLVCNLIKESVLDRGIVSYMGARSKNSIDLMTRYGQLHLLEEASILDNLTPMVLDMQLENENFTQHPASSIIIEHYHNSFLSVVSETLTDPNVIFYSEKTWKPIAIGHPFMILSSPGMIKGLHDMGYQTFNEFWDESYDSMPLLEDRVQLIVRELVRLSRYSDRELIDMRRRLEPILEHNRQLFKSVYAKMVGENSRDDLYLYNIVKPIWESIKNNK